MLVGFMFASIWTLSIMSLYQAYLQYGQRRAVGIVRPHGTGEPAAGGLGGWRPAENQARALLLQRSTAAQHDPAQSR